MSRYTCTKSFANMRRRNVNIALQACLICLTCATVGLFYWLSCDFRATGIAASLAGCSSPPWYYLYRMPRSDLAYFEPGELHVPFNPNKYIRGAGRRVGLFQVCNQPVRSSWHLNALLDRKRSYSLKHGYEYQLASTGKQDGVWAKITALREKVRRELSRSKHDRLDWLW